ncbi:IPT/TIG domain-containing protein [Rapidithrix thailandica]|uniref:IPT/TIG domain-containing protein n=1 Tax=Rapidithrix thailandica TaxID=413964 RepID=A0AAW9RUT3_9BACT
MVNFYKTHSAKAIFYTVLFVSFSILLSSCKDEKTEIVPYPFHEIVSFILPDIDGEPLQAALSEEIIWLYWPAGKPLPEYINPEIKISEKASIQPASGEKVPLENGLKYTVTSEDKQSTTYTLKVVLNQPTPEVSSFRQEVKLNGGDYFAITGKYFLPNHTQLYFLNTDNETVEIPLSTEHTKVDHIESLPFDQALLAPGTYQAKLLTGLHTLSIGAVRVYFLPEIHSFDPASGAAGTEITLTGAHFTNQKEDIQVTFGETAAEVLSAQTTKLTVKVPDGAVSGKLSITLNGQTVYSPESFTVVSGEEAQ